MSAGNSAADAAVRRPPVPFPRTFREALRQFFGNGASAHPAVQFAKYGTVGALATAVNAAAVFFFCWKAFRCLSPDDPVVRLLSIEPGASDPVVRARLVNWAYVCAFPISNAFCYALNRAFVFVPGRHGMAREFAGFLAASATALFAGMAVSWALIRFSGAETSVAVAANMVSAVAINYVLRKFAVFAG
ncbi:MAG: GtrA family protein [Kiritimatiellae bacterium]|nr:GtrA family protein [Kiritimatiellia bacterium]